MKKQRGSALIIALFIISAIGSVSFGVGRLIYLQIASANAYEKGIYAYYAAESGIEEGFLRYRYDQEATVPSNIDISNEKVYRSNLALKTSNTGSNNLGILPSTVNNEITNQVYDLRINPFVKIFGYDVDNDGVSKEDLKSPQYGLDPANSALQIVRDESKKFKVDLSGLKDLRFYFKPIKGSALSGSSILDNENCVLIEAKIVAKTNPTSNLEEHKKIYKNSACDYGLAFNFSDSETVGTYVQDSSISVDGVTVFIYRIDSLKDVWFGHNGIVDQAELFIKPIGASLVFLIEPKNNNDIIFGPNTKITSAGYYMGIKRGLEANVDRQSGSLYDLFDYVVYNAH
jgi:Tfp pilus assembly protein PilX